MQQINRDDEILRLFPESILKIMKIRFEKNLIQEIRIKIKRPIIITTDKGEEITEYVVNSDDIKYIMMKISNYSIYAFEEEIKQGYITLKGGHRVGLAGECVISNGEIKTIKNISSLNIRISREVIGASNKIFKYITEIDRVFNTLIVSPPKCGKTTILRDIAKNISNGVYSQNFSGKKVVVVDERSEIAGCYNGVPQMNVGIRTDVLDNCLKKIGMIMAIRSLSPDVLICDEIGTSSEMEAIQMAFNSGVNIIITVHGFDYEDIYNREIFKELIDGGMLERVIVLSNRKGVGTIESVYKIDRGGDYECLEF